MFCVNDVGVESGPVSLNPSIGRWCRVARGADSNRLLAIGGNKFQNRMRDRVSKAHKVFFLSLFSICVVLFFHPERSYTEVGRKNDNDHREIPRCDHQWRAICFIYPPFFLPVSHTRFFLPLQLRFKEETKWISDRQVNLEQQQPDLDRLLKETKEEKRRLVNNRVESVEDIVPLT